jgi:hypothetical protein
VNAFLSDPSFCPTNIHGTWRTFPPFFLLFFHFSANNVWSMMDESINETCSGHDSTGRLRCAFVQVSAKQTNTSIGHVVLFC